MGKILLSCLPGIKGWLDSQGKTMLWDIYSWDPVPPHRCLGWSFSDCPVEIKDENTIFLEHLAGAVPLASKEKDSHDWGSISGEYSTKQ